MNKFVSHLLLTLLFSFISWAQESFVKTSSYWATGNNSTKQWIADFNGDGLADNLVYDQVSWKVKLSDGKTFQTESVWLNQSPATSYFYIGDFNGDGMKDIATYWSLGYWYVALAYQDLLAYTPVYKFKPFTLWKTGIFTEGYLQYLSGDFNGDGIDDLMSYRTVNDKTVFTVSTSNGITFSVPTIWKNDSQENFNKIYVADIDADGDCDIITYRYSVTGMSGHDYWYVSKSTGSSFTSFTYWSGGQGAGSNGPFFGDVDGDGDMDKINFYSDGGSSGNNWWVAKSDGNSFGGESHCWWREGIGATAGYIGDFDGDRLCDAAFLKDGNFSVGINTSPLPTKNHERVVAVWFNGFYLDNNFEGRMDELKTPVVGWGSADSTITGIYNSRNKIVLDKQIDAMIKCGINLIIFDITNGWRFDDGTLQSAVESQTLDSLFYIMNNRKNNNKKWIPIAIGLGYEFWGKRQIDGYKELYTSNGWEVHDNEWEWNDWGGNDSIRWNKQYSRQRVALNEIKSKFTENASYGSIYYNYLGHPLIVAFLDGGLDYPPRKELAYKVPGDNIKMWHYNDFTIIPANHWNYTTGYNQTTGQLIFINGRDQKRFWGWGENHEKLLQPYNKECMSVLPGTKTYWVDDPVWIPRDMGNYYINSWKRVIDSRPNIVIIGGWNNWPEETSIEGCVGVNGWKDYYGNSQYDWYLQITKAYCNIFLKDSIPAGIYIQDENFPTINFYFNGSYATNRTTAKPSGKPIISLPHSWCNSHGLYLSKIMTNDDVTLSFNIAAYPNPFNPDVTISFEVPENGKVEIKIFDLLGRELETVVKEVMEKGTHQINWVPKDIASGVYLYRVSWRNEVKTQKIIYLR